MLLNVEDMDEEFLSNIEGFDAIVYLESSHMLPDIGEWTILEDPQKVGKSTFKHSHGNWVTYREEELIVALVTVHHAQDTKRIVSVWWWTWVCSRVYNYMDIDSCILCSSKSQIFFKV